MSYKPHEKHTVIGDHIIFEEIVSDECASNPLEACDAMGSIFSFSSRHCNSLKREQVEAYIDEYGEDAVFLSYFEHGLCRWGVKGTMSGMPDFHWDGVACAGLWIPDKHLLEEAKDLEGEERRKKMEEWAGQACEVYTQWCNGEVYGIVVEVYQARYENGILFDRKEDYRNSTPIFEESCWGYCGMEYAEEALKEEYLPWARKTIEEEEAA